MMEATAVGFSVGAFFLNRGHFDLWYHWLALVAALNLCASAALRTAPQLGAATESKRNKAGNVVVAVPSLRGSKRGAAMAASAEPAGTRDPAAIVWKSRKRWR